MSAGYSKKVGEGLQGLSPTFLLKLDNPGILMYGVKRRYVAPALLRNTRGQGKIIDLFGEMWYNSSCKHISKLFKLNMRVY